jgi:hypothetical protein
MGKTNCHPPSLSNHRLLHRFYLSLRLTNIVVIFWGGLFWRMWSRSMMLEQKRCGLRSEYIETFQCPGSHIYYALVSTSFFGVIGNLKAFCERITMESKGCKS